MVMRLCIEIEDDLADRLKGMVLEGNFDSVEAFVVDALQQNVEIHDDIKNEEMLKADTRKLALEQAVEDWDKSARRLCIRHFFEEPRYTVDMSRYREMVNGAHGVEQSVKDGLTKYLDERKILGKVYLEVRNHFRICTLIGYRSDWPYSDPPEKLPPLPTLDDLDARFRVELADVYRRADTTVAKRLRSSGVKP